MAGDTKKPAALLGATGWLNWLAVPLIGVWLATHLVPQAPLIDDMAYWGTRDGVLYEGTWNTAAVYVYSPAFAQAIAPFVQLDYMAFHVGLSIVQLAAVLWLLGPALTLAFCLTPFLGGSYIWNGNITPLLAVALVRGWWPVLVLTKILPGVTMLWYVGRRDWRGLAVALGVLAAIVAVSFALWPGAWFEWADALLRAGGAPVKGWPIPLLVRLPLAAALALYAGYTNRRWLLAPAAFLSMADIWWSGIVWLAAIPRLRRDDAVQEPVHRVEVAGRPGLRPVDGDLVVRGA